MNFLVVLTNDGPVCQLVGLIQSLVETVPTDLPYSVSALLTPDVTTDAHTVITALGCHIVPVPPSPRHRNYVPTMPTWQTLLTKLEVWNVTDMQGETVVYVDTDIVFNVDPSWLFKLDGRFHAVRDDWTDCESRHASYYNSGLMVLQPDKKVFKGMWDLIEHAQKPFTNGDQEVTLSCVCFLIKCV